MRTSWRLRAAVLAGGCLLTAACGSEGDGSGDEQVAAENLSSQIRTSGEVAGQESVTEDEADCIAEGTVDDLGVEALQGYGILTDDLRVDKSVQGVTMEAGHADALASVFVSCVDAEAMFERQLLAESRRTTAKERRCVRRAVDTRAVRRVLSLSFQGEEADVVYSGLREALAPCAPRGQGRAGQ